MGAGPAWVAVCGLTSSPHQFPGVVAAGANDVRVPIDQNDRLVAAAREAGVHVEYLVFNDEGHGFRRRANGITAVESYLDFLDRFLKASQRGEIP